MRALPSPCEVLLTAALLETDGKVFATSVVSATAWRWWMRRAGPARTSRETAWYRLIMIVVRCTAKLLERLPDRSDPSNAVSTSRLGDWYATLIRTRRGHFVLAMARETLLPVVVTGRDLRALPQRLVEQVAAMLESYGVPADAVANERDAMRDVAYTRTDDRSNVGVLTEFQRLLAFDLSEPSDLSLLDLSLRLAWTPIVARNTFSIDGTCKLFGVEPPRRDWWQQQAETVVN